MATRKVRRYQKNNKIVCSLLMSELIYFRLLLEGSSHEAGVFGEIIIRDGVQAVEEAFHLFNLAADQHIPNAEHYLATMHEYGIGIPQDYSKALHFYQRSAEQGFLESMYHLSLMHVYGRGVPQDFKIALPLLEAAAREDHAPSCYYLGICKMYGYGCVLDYELAFNWFEKATSLNDFRVSAKAGEAAKGLRTQIDEANATNDRILQTLQQRSEIEAD